VTTWDLQEIEKVLLELESYPRETFTAEAKKLRAVISIEAQCKRVIDLLGA
jgi:hypothetical protein